MSTKTYSILNTDFNEPDYGLADIPETNALLMRLVPAKGRKHWTTLEVGETTTTAFPSIYTILRTN